MPESDRDIFDAPQIGDVVAMGAFTVMYPHARVSFKAGDKKTCTVFLLLGYEPKDGSNPLNPDSRLRELGWRQEPDLADLLKRAGMDQYDFNTGVVRNTDTQNGDRRIHVISHFDPAFADCVGIGWYGGENVMGQGIWHITHFSPARARLIAAHLLRHADQIEAANGTPASATKRKATRHGKTQCR